MDRALCVPAPADQGEGGGPHTGGLERERLGASEGGGRWGKEGAGPHWVLLMTADLASGRSGRDS